jgi:hypothetical protein
MGFSWAQQPTCSDIETAKKEIYGFRPSELSKEQQQQKSSEMDRFWELVESRGQSGANCLREILLAEKEDPYFAFDASALLYRLDQSEPSLAVIVQGLARTNLKEVDTLAYIRFLLRLSQQGVDIGPPVEKYLTYPDVEVYVSEHGGMKLNRDMAAVILYGSMLPDLADSYLIAALQANEPYARSTAALILAFQLTQEGLEALNSFQERETFAPEIKEEIERSLKRAPVATPGKINLSREQVLARLRQIPNYGDDSWGVAGNDELEASAIATLQEEDLPLLRAARRRSITGVSDEALYEYFALTRILRGVINRLDLYKDYRKH